MLSDDAIRECPKCGLRAFSYDTRCRGWLCHMTNCRHFEAAEKPTPEQARIAELEANNASLRQRVEELEAGKPKPADLAVLFAQLTDDQRDEVVSGYCRHCWRPDPRCQCGNDE